MAVPPRHLSSQISPLKFTLAPALVLCCLLTGCLSKEPLQTTHRFRPQLTEITALESLGTRPLRFDGVRFPVEVGQLLTWRVSPTELVVEDYNLWARRPADLLEERLRDLLFGVGGFRQIATVGGPELGVQLVVFEGDVSGPEALAVVELIIELEDGNAVHHRTRIRVEEPLKTKDARGLALAMGDAISSASERCSSWLRQRLGGR